MIKAFLIVITLISLFANNLLHAETKTLNENNVFEPFIFMIGMDFSNIQTKFNLEKKTPGVNFIKESNWYILKTPVGSISLQEWRGKLHCVAYDIDVNDVELKEQTIEYLFEKYKNSFDWIDRVDNGLYISYESSNDSIQGIYSYSLGATVSFTSNEVRKAETKIRFPNL